VVLPTVGKTIKPTGAGMKTEKFSLLPPTVHQAHTGRDSEIVQALALFIVRSRPRNVVLET
jgi:hypothetical protein